MAAPNHTYHLPLPQTTALFIAEILGAPLGRMTAETVGEEEAHSLVEKAIETGRMIERALHNGEIHICPNCQTEYGPECHHPDCQERLAEIEWERLADDRLNEMRSKNSNL